MCISRIKLSSMIISQRKYCKKWTLKCHYVPSLFCHSGYLINVYIRIRYAIFTTYHDLEQNQTQSVIKTAMRPWTRNSKSWLQGNYKVAAQEIFSRIRTGVGYVQASMTENIQSNDSDSELLFNAATKDISVICVTAHWCASGLKKEAGPTVRLPRHRHFVVFFSVPVEAPTWSQPFYGKSDPFPPFQSTFTMSMGILRTYFRLKPRVPQE